ncbi:MAG: zinc-binding dehydrogenase, partial [Venatoribacter sp.]
PTHRVAVVGIGGLGHLALQFLNKWGCEVTALSSNLSKAEEAKAFGAHRVCSSTDKAELKKLYGYFDFILVTVNQSLDWHAYTKMLNKKGRLHVVGAVLEPMPVSVMALMDAQRSVSSSPVGSPATLVTMLDFAARHGIQPLVEVFPMSQVNAAIEHLESGKARYRVVLKADDF